MSIVERVLALNRVPICSAGEHERTEVENLVRITKVKCEQHTDFTTFLTRALATCKQELGKDHHNRVCCNFYDLSGNMSSHAHSPSFSMDLARQADMTGTTSS